MNHFIEQARDQVRDQADHVLDTIAQHLPIDLANFSMEDGDTPERSGVVSAEAAESWRERAAQKGLDIATEGLYQVLDAKHVGRVLLMSVLGVREPHHAQRLA